MKNLIMKNIDKSDVIWIIISIITIAAITIALYY